MRVSKRASAVAAIAAVALVAAGCGGGDDEESTGNSDKTANGAITIDGTQPANPLLPSATSETGGGDILDFMWTGLINYPPGGGAPVNAVAESIETSDAQTYTVKIKKAVKFHDGTEVKAKNFVDAWNFTANSDNGQQQASFFSDIEGYADVHTEDPDGEEGPQKAPPPKSPTMSGLAVVDDYTFTIKLAAANSIFPVKLGYSAYYPMPDSFFAATDKNEWGKKPVGNGPVKFVSWTDNVEIKLTRFDDYTLDDKVKIKDVTVKLYQDDTAAYADLLANNLDFQQQVPASSLAGEKWKTDLGTRALTVDIPVMQIIAFPIYDKRFQNKDLRRAVSLSINREEIASKIFFNTRKAATGWVAPGIPGADQYPCTTCKFDPDGAKAALQAAGGFQGEMVLYYNADASHKEWMEAAANSVASTLGITVRAEGMPTFAVFRQNIDAHKMTGPYRAGWQADYPDPENWLGPLYVTGASSNDGLYSNPQVDALYQEGSRMADANAAHAKFAESMKIVDDEVPSIPIVSVTQQAGVSNRVTGVKTNWVGSIDLSTVELV
ncbi:peptide ABC transporter substrate-binding protein [Phytohabitans suffuscus]|uniref:Peptide ABC transporter substrate-binding protein n=1 Tax=Phytohabitans suffuscus TaxID=624315 RepID=A0A6F8YLM8_9ACTN|nr:ABC transporter substrate-binding protein [Phytohabitans suffuscus]BCB86851.1 peptide ABC transporter substrate-binding protein [Phytohabitans suffuscus]